MTSNPNNVRKKLANHILADGFEPIIDLEKSHGSYLVDHRNGSEYLDMFSMYASGSVGYNHPYIIERKNLLGEIAINKTTLSDVYNIYYADFLDTFNKIGIPSYLPNAFFPLISSSKAIRSPTCNSNPVLIGILKSIIK